MTPFYLQADGAVGLYVKVAEEYLGEIVSVHQRIWDEMLHIVLLANRASAH
jgi:L-rhamnose mutarotase